MGWLILYEVAIFVISKVTISSVVTVEIARRGGMTTLESRSDKIAQSEAKFSL